ncbi:hypothetical protein E1B28_002586 [Marasmius oreades]|uniref:Uncharacterized protein n=1 Tax=Marasmius oreades TaxID=181124 RepID=A0A9P7RP01_9AGAR|nr:uncharacterized protein E1B28_002586 [Marasmius oreades]KAG7086646.1 hypothetical protein E1B28_002586 [Marasmius oreades]
MTSTIPVGTRVFYYRADGVVLYGTVQSVSLTEGTRLLNIRADDGKVVTLPLDAVTRV